MEFFCLTAKGDWLTALSLYSAKDLNELPTEGLHLEEAAVATSLTALILLISA